MKITVYNKLRKYESFLTTAHYANFIRSLTVSQMNELVTLGKEIGINYVHNHCPKCALDFVKKLAAPYFEQKEKLETKKQEKNNDTESKE